MIRNGPIVEIPLWMAFSLPSENGFLIRQKALVFREWSGSLKALCDPPGGLHLQPDRNRLVVFHAHNEVNCFSRKDPVSCLCRNYARCRSWKILTRPSLR